MSSTNFLIMATMALLLAFPSDVNVIWHDICMPNSTDAAIYTRRADEEKLTAKRDCLMKEQEELDKARTNAFTAYRKNKEIYDSVCGTQQVQLQTEQEYIRLKTLSDTANGMIPGKRKIELETYMIH